MAFKNFAKRLGVIGAAIALTMSAAALSNPASAAITTTLQNYHTGDYVTDSGYYYWTHSTNATYSTIQNTGTGGCLYNVLGTTGMKIGTCSQASNYLWQASSVVSINGTISYQFKNGYSHSCLYITSSGAVHHLYLDACTSNHADYWH